MQLRAFLELARISNLPTVWSNCLLAWQAGGTSDLRVLGLSIAGGSLVYTGGMFLNDYCDHKFDSAHRRERPIPSGRARLRSAGAIAAIFILLGTLGLAWLNPWPALGLAALVITYNYWHKKNPLSPVLMAACRAMLVITVAGVTAGGILALALGVYILAISMVARREAFAGQAVPWPGIAVLALAFALVPFASGRLPDGWEWVLPVLVLTQVRHVLGPARAIGKCVGGLLAAIPLVDLWNLSVLHEVSPTIVLLFLALSCLALGLQRIAPAT